MYNIQSVPVSFKQNLNVMSLQNILLSDILDSGMRPYRAQLIQYILQDLTMNFIFFFMGQPRQCGGTLDCRSTVRAINPAPGA